MLDLLMHMILHMFNNHYFPSHGMLTWVLECEILMFNSTRTLFKTFRLAKLVLERYDEYRTEGFEFGE